MLSFASTSRSAIGPANSAHWADVRASMKSLVVSLIGLAVLLTACAKPPVAVVLPPRPVFVGYEETGEASWYGQPFHGRQAASGEVYDMSQMTAAHRTLPFGTWVAVENVRNGRTAEVRITDRGPFKDNRILDLSRAAAQVLGAVGPGVIPVRLRVIGLPGGTRETRRGPFTVQVASFTAEQRAVALKDMLGREWPDSFVQRAEVGGRTFYRVRIGTYASRLEAQRVAQRLAAAGYTVIVMGE